MRSYVEIAAHIGLVLFILVILFAFLYFNPVGIKIGYWLSGGSAENEYEEFEDEELLRDYKEYKSTYEMYVDTSNVTSEKWAETARQKANKIADKYNELVGENILEKLGEY